MEEASSKTSKREDVQNDPLNFSKKSIFRKDPVYDKAQFLGFSLNTDDRLVNYMGLEDEQKDWKSRVQVMKEAIEQIRNSDKINPSEKCIKIFMAPEFFFRGKKGAYDMDTASKIPTALRNLVKDPSYKDWLFVFGTIVAFTKDEREVHAPYTVYNYSLVQKGNGTEKDSVIVMKERMSSLDYLRANSPDNKKITMMNLQIPKIKIDAKPRDEEQRKNYDGHAIFEMDGIRFGIEICIDNLRSRIDNSKLSADSPIDIQLVPSCGIQSFDLKVAQKLKENGMVFLVDGKRNGTSTLLQKSRKEILPLSCEKLNLDPKRFGESVFFGDGSLNVYPSKELIKSKDKGF